MKCKKCGAKLTVDDLFCPECGAKVEKEILKREEEHKLKKEHHKSHKEEYKAVKSPWARIIPLTILVLFVVFVLVVPLPYSATETYTEKEPYETQESYTEQEPHEICTEREYSSDVYHKYEGQQTARWKEGVISVATQVTSGYKVEYRLYNYEDAPGNFEIRFDLWNWIDVNNRNVIDSFKEEYTVGKNSYKDGYYLTDWMIDRVKDQHVENLVYTAELIKPKLRECETGYEKTTKYRAVTKYRDVEKTKTVTKYATIFQRLRGQI